MSATVFINGRIAHVDDDIRWTVDDDAELEGHLNALYGPTSYGTWMVLYPRGYVAHQPQFIAEVVADRENGRIVTVSPPDIDPGAIY